jgi:Ras-related protein Rab-8A
MSVYVSIPIKLMIIGDSGVGKSCLSLRFMDGVFTPTFITTAPVGIPIKMMDLDGNTVRLQVWDTPGQERFKTITSQYYRGVQGLLVAHDITDQDSFGNVRKWMESINQHAKAGTKRILIGTKSDLVQERVVSKERGQALSKEYGISFFECSAKEDKQVTELFAEIARQVLNGSEVQTSAVQLIDGGSGAHHESKCC